MQLFTFIFIIFFTRNLKKNGRGATVKHNIYLVKDREMKMLSMCEKSGGRGKVKKLGVPVAPPPNYFRYFLPGKRLLMRVVRRTFACCPRKAQIFFIKIMYFGENNSTIFFHEMVTHKIRDQFMKLLGVKIMKKMGGENCKKKNWDGAAVTHYFLA